VRDNRRPVGKRVSNASIFGRNRSGFPNRRILIEGAGAPTDLSPQRGRASLLSPIASERLVLIDEIWVKTNMYAVCATKGRRLIDKAQSPQVAP
jgi:hypothetical protein